MSEKIYAWLLRLYPRAFREEYGAASQQLFRDRWNAERGLRARCRLGLDVVADLALTVPREHRRRARPPQPAGYRLPEEAVAAMVTRGRLSAYPALLLFFAMGWLGGAPHLPLLAGYLLLALAFTAAFVRRRIGSKRRLLSLELILGPDRIERRQPGFDLTLRRNEVARVSEVDQGLIVWASDRRMIWVPSRLNGFEEVRDHLAAWMPIGREDPPRHGFRIKPRHAYFLLFPAYVSAVLVRSLSWYLPLALLSGAGLLVMVRQAMRQRPGLRRKPAPVVILLALLAVLILKAAIMLRVK